MDRLQDLLRHAGASALVVVAPSSRDPFLAPFVGRAHLHGAFLVVPADGEPRLAYQTPLEREEAASTGLALLTPDDLDIARTMRDGASPASVLATSLARALQRCGLAPGFVLLAGHAPAGTLTVAATELIGDGWRIHDGAPVVLAWRKRKRDQELAACRHVARATADCMRAVARRLAGASVVPNAPGTDGVLHVDGHALTVGRLRSEVARRLVEAGLDQPHGNLIAPGAEGAVPHNTGDDGSRIRAGASLIVDLFPQGGVFADMTRTFAVGAVSETLQGAHVEVQQALEDARASARTGVHGWTLQEQVCARFRQAGWSDPIARPGAQSGYVHGLGHGVGYEVHELPSFRQEASAAEGTLEAGDVFTLEPGLYSPEGGWAVRIEDTFLLGDSGLEQLTALPYDLDPRAY